MSTKRYYWLKLKENFFTDKTIKKLRKIAGGDLYTIIYLKLLLKSMKTNGKLYYDGIEDNFCEELALDIDENSENVKVTVMYLMKHGLLKEVTEQEMELIKLHEMVGSETNKAELMRRKRAKEKEESLIENKCEIKSLPPKSNAERQQTFRAKQYCEQQPHIPLIEDYCNKTRYGGNYYTVLKREKGVCAICKSNDTICVYHIDGYDKEKPENNAKNKMITLCQSCCAKIHKEKLEIPTNILINIGYFSNESNIVTSSYPCYSNERNVTCYPEKDIDIDIEKDIDINNIEKNNMNSLKKERKNNNVTNEKISFNEIIENFCIGNFELEKKLKNFVQMRFRIKKGLTNSGLKELLNTLVEISDGNQKNMIEIVKKSLRNSWADFYKLKENNQKTAHELSYNIEEYENCDPLEHFNSLRQNKEDVV